MIGADQAKHCTDLGYVMLFYDRHPLGIGLYAPFDDDAGGRVNSMFPKAWAVAEGEEQVKKNFQARENFSA